MSPLSRTVRSSFVLGLLFLALPVVAGAQEEVPGAAAPSAREWLVAHNAEAVHLNRVAMGVLLALLRQGPEG
jgi:hypothetical protein